MNTSDLLEQLLGAGLGQQSGAARAGGGGGLGAVLGSLLGEGGSAGGLGGLGSLLGGAASGGQGGLGDLLGGLLGGTPQPNQSGAGSSGNSGGLGYGSLATLGMLAFQAYRSWQAQQSPAQASQAAMQPQTVNLLSGPEVEEHSHAILRALIAASKADGRIDEQETQLIYAEIGKHAQDAELQAWLDQEVQRPLDPAHVALAAQTPAMAAEMYLASALLIGNLQGGERDYLNQLAQHMRIDPQLQSHLDAQIGQS